MISQNFARKNQKPYTHKDIKEILRLSKYVTLLYSDASFQSSGICMRGNTPLGFDIGDKGFIL